MKLYFLALGTAVVVCVGCSLDGNQHPAQSTGWGSSHMVGHAHGGPTKGEYHAPPPAMMMRPGPMVDGPGPGVIPMMGVPCGPGGNGMARTFATTNTQIMFGGPDGMHIGWQVPTGFAENQLVAPARYNFVQGSTYQLKISGIPGREGLTIYPTLQVFPSHPNTDVYLSHSAVPVELTQEDLDQVESKNLVTKVIYLPDAQFQELAIAGVETLVSTRLDPGVDPIQAADKRGTIMAVIRMGNLEREMPGEMGGRPVAGGREDNVNQIAHKIDGAMGELVPPMPIGPAGNGRGPGIPGDIIVAGSGMPGAPIDGIAWGQPITGTPIGLPGPTHLPYGGPAGLKSHTVRNKTPMNLPKPVDHMLIDVAHRPGYSLPEPVRYIEYTEDHPVYRPGELSNPAWNAQGMGGPAGAGAAGGQYCPPGQAVGQ